MQALPIINASLRMASASNYIYRYPIFHLRLAFPS